MPSMASVPAEFNNDEPMPAPAADPAQETLRLLHEHFSAHDSMASVNEVMRVVTDLYLERLDPAAPPSPTLLESQLLQLVNAAIKSENTKAAIATEKLPIQRCLTHWQVAQVLLRLHHVVRIAPSTEETDREYDLLTMYVADGPSKGTHTTSEDDIRTTARRYNTALTLKDFAEVQAVLREDSPRLTLVQYRDLVPVGNGVFHYGREALDITVDGKSFHFEPKSLHPFDPALVFLAKSHVAYVEGAPRPVITHPTDGTVWDIESWIQEFFDQPGQEGLADLIWEIIGAVIRPYVSWGKTAWFYSEAGNNGKGTLCALMRNLIGSGSHTSIPLSDFGKDFALEPLVRATAIIVDENDVGTFIDKAANLKAIVTGDVIQINRKYRVPIAYQFHGFMVQCLNEFPQMKDKSESNYRRQLFVPFSKSFTGRERKYIKDDYLKRRDVLEYALWYVLNRAGATDPGCYYQLSEPPATVATLAEYKEINDPVREFWKVFRDRFVWDLLPWEFLYDLYKAWYPLVYPSGHGGVSKRRFVTDLRIALAEDPEWHGKKGADKHRVGQLMDAPEPLISEYDLVTWKTPTYSGPDPLKTGQPKSPDSYYGVRRVSNQATTAPTAPEEA